MKTKFELGQRAWAIIDNKAKCFIVHSLRVEEMIVDVTCTGMKVRHHELLSADNDSIQDIDALQCYHSKEELLNSL